MHRMAINPGPVGYFPNALAQNSPAPASAAEGGFVHYAERVDGSKIRARSESFRDHFSQATLFWNSMSAPEKEHIIDAFHFEVGSVKDKKIKQAVADMFAHVAPELGEAIAAGIGVNPPPQTAPSGVTAASPALSQENTIKTARTRKVAILIENGVCPIAVKAMMDALKAAGASAETVSCKLSPVTAKDGTQLAPNKDFTTSDAVLYDAVFIPGGAEHVAALKQNTDARHFINQALYHAKTVGAADEAVELMSMTDASSMMPVLPSITQKPWIFEGIVLVQGATDMAPFCTEFVNQLAMHRHWARHH